MIITTIEEQRLIGRAARHAGGYAELAKRLSRVKQKDISKNPDIFDLAPYEMIVAGDELIPVNRVRRITMLDQEGEAVMVRTDDGDFEARGQDALSIILTLKPSALEGRRRRWKKGSWAYHNMVGHPMMQILAWLGMGKAAIRFHDKTVPDPR